VDDSIGTAQIGPPGVNAPIRIASDGDDPTPGPSQVDPPGGDAGGSGDPGPGGDGDTPGGGGDTPDGGGDTSGSGGENPGSVGGVPGTEGLDGDRRGLGDGSGGDGPGTGTQDLVFDEDTSSGTQPVADVLAGGDGGAGKGDVPAGSVRVLGAQASDGLPVTGLGVLAMFVLGLVLMASGAALRRGGIEPS
jgi:hypothetical protein